MRRGCLTVLRNCSNKPRIWPRTGWITAHHAHLSTPAAQGPPQHHNRLFENNQDGTQHVQKQELSVYERHLLGKARLFGIATWEQFLFEADVGHTANIGTRMLDTDQHRRDLDLWLVVLELKQYLDGDQGVQHIWKAMRSRGPKIVLDPGNRNALDLYSAFVHVAATGSRRILQLILSDFIHDQIMPLRLFNDIVGRLLQHTPSHALYAADELQRHSLDENADIGQIFEDACRCETVESAMHAFREILSLLPTMKIYHIVIPRLWELGWAEEAFRMHDHLLQCRDLPRSIEVLHPFVHHLARVGQEVDPFLRDLEQAGVFFEGQLRRDFELLQSLNIDEPTASTYLPAQKRQRKLKDEIIARALATPGFSFDFILHGLRFFGLLEVGPLAIRQMILMSNSMASFQSKLARISELGIDAGSSKFVGTIRSLADSSHWVLIRSIAQADIHHDELEDMDLQFKLLAQYHREADLASVNRTLAVIRHGKVWKRQQSQSANTILLTAAAAEDWESVLQIMTRIRLMQWTVAYETIQKICDILLRPSTTVPEAAFDRPGLLIAILQQIMAAGKPVLPHFWNQALRNLGRQRRFRELECLLDWIVDCQRHDRAKRPILGSAEAQAHVDLNRILNPLFQDLLVTWSFKIHWRRSKSRHGWLSDSPTEPWMWGIQLLRRLCCKELGIAVDVRRLYQTFNAQWRMLFMPRTLQMYANRNFAIKAGLDHRGPQNLHSIMHEYFQVGENPRDGSGANDSGS